MKQQATRDLYAYWNTLRRGRAAPDLAEIDPTAIRDVLADTFMLEVDPGREFPIRLAGTRFNGLFDAEQKGRPFLGLWRGEERRNVAAVVLAVADGACPVVAGGVAAPSGQDESGSFEFLFLPLRHHGKTHARILGIVTPARGPGARGPACRGPAWLGLLPPGPMALRSLRIVDDAAPELLEPRPRRVAAGRRIEPAFDATLAPTGSLLFAQGPTRPARPALRLIQGGRPL